LIAPRWPLPPSDAYKKPQPPPENPSPPPLSLSFFTASSQNPSPAVAISLAVPGSPELQRAACKLRLSSWSLHAEGIEPARPQSLPVSFSLSPLPPLVVGHGAAVWPPPASPSSSKASRWAPSCSGPQGPISPLPHAL
jgi:hypothetical protein